MTEAIRIQTESTVIPIEFNGLHFEFHTDDTSIDQFRKGITSLQDEIKAIEPDEGEELEVSKATLKRGYDYILGDGAFDKIYEKTPSVISLTNAFFHLGEAISNRLKSLGINESQADKAKKYLKK